MAPCTWVPRHTVWRPLVTRPFQEVSKIIIKLYSDDSTTKHQLLSYCAMHNRGLRGCQTTTASITFDMNILKKIDRTLGQGSEFTRGCYRKTIQKYKRFSSAGLSKSNKSSQGSDQEISLIKGHIVMFDLGAGEAVGLRWLRWVLLWSPSLGTTLNPVECPPIPLLSCYLKAEPSER